MKKATKKSNAINEETTFAEITARMLKERKPNVTLFDYTLFRFGEDVSVYFTIKDSTLYIISSETGEIILSAENFPSFEN